MRVRGPDIRAAEVAGTGNSSALGLPAIALNKNVITNIESHCLSGEFGSR